MRVWGSVTGRARVFALLVVIGCAACGASLGGDASAATPVTYKTGPCPAEQAKALANLHAACGTLTVPENRSRPGEGKVQLPVVIVPSKTQPAAADPMVYLAGGPGANGIAQAEELARVGINDKRDLIIMNQRGNAYSTPNLACPELDRD